MPLKILLIEDNEDHVCITKRALQHLSREYDITCVNEADEGISRIDQEEYHLVLCDYRLPGMSALDILREVRNKGKGVPFVVITSAGNEKVAVEVMKSGAIDYISKDSAYFDTLPLVIERAMESFRHQEDRRRMEEELRASEQKYRMLVEHMPAVTYLSRIDANSSIVYVSSQVKDLLGFSPEECQLDAEFRLKRLHPDDREWVKREFERCHQGLQPFSAEYRMIHRNGKTICVYDSAFMIWDKTSREAVYQGVIFDVTEQRMARHQLEEAYLKLKHAQEELIQSGKMAAMGQLATGISHELNQPLTGIKGFAQAVLRDLDKTSSLRGDMEKIVEQANRMDSIIRNVRFFARKSEFKMEELDVNRPIKDSLMLLQEQLKVHSIDLITQLDESLPMIMGDQNQLQQAFINIVTNARDAIEALGERQGGQLKVSSRLSKDSRFIQAVFEDTGCGIASEDQKNIFNPFFTTKSPNGGMGLGLSIVYRIIENHGGRIEVASSAGKGTKITVSFLPAAKAAVPVNQ